VVQSPLEQQALLAMQTAPHSFSPAVARSVSQPLTSGAVLLQSANPLAQPV
jgi:hypothetical protein